LAAREDPFIELPLDHLKSFSAHSNRSFNDAIAAKRAEFLQESLEQYEGAAKKGHSRLRGWGGAEAVIGAFVWTLVLIAISFVLKYNGIDLVEIYHKVAEH
jgi:hypothetical protein